MPDLIAWAKKLVGLRVGSFHMYRARAVRVRTDDIPPWPAAMPRVSIVTPVRNQVRYIDATLESVLSQRCPGLQYIVFDGASNDGTAEAIARRAADLAYSESSPDRGQADAINKGFARADGEILGWLNGDDVLLPGALARVLDFFARHPEIDAVYGDRLVLDEQGREVGRWVLPAHSDRILSWCDFVPQETLFWRRRLWDRVGGKLDDSFRFAMDWDLLVRFRQAGARMAHIPRFLGGFRVHAAQKTSAEINEVGFREMSSIRLRCLGRVPSRGEIAVASVPYLLRQMAVDLASRWSPRG
jgi:glycosyltransferase involved in cell wall biosynthesis